MSANYTYDCLAGQELIVSKNADLVASSVHDRARGTCVTGLIAVRYDDVETLRSALLDVKDASAEEATES